MTETSTAIIYSVVPPIFLLAHLTLAAWALYDLSKRKVHNKVLWVILIIWVGIFGSLVYLLVARKNAE